MHQTGSVSVAYAGTGLHNQRDGFFDRKTPALSEQGLEVRTGDVFHNDEQLPAIQPKVMHGDDVGM